MTDINIQYLNEMNLNKFKLKNVNFLKLTKVVLGNYFKKAIKEIGI